MSVGYYQKNGTAAVPGAFLKPVWRPQFTCRQRTTAVYIMLSSGSFPAVCAAYVVRGGGEYALDADGIGEGEGEGEGEGGIEGKDGGLYDEDGEKECVSLRKRLEQLSKKNIELRLKQFEFAILKEDLLAVRKQLAKKEDLLAVRKQLAKKQIEFCLSLKRAEERTRQIRHLSIGLTGFLALGVNEVARGSCLLINLNCPALASLLTTVPFNKEAVIFAKIHGFVLESSARLSVITYDSHGVSQISIPKNNCEAYQVWILVLRCDHGRPIRTTQYASQFLSGNFQCKNSAHRS